jgi:hypothetical protein
LAGSRNLTHLCHDPSALPQALEFQGLQNAPTKGNKIKLTLCPIRYDSRSSLGNYNRLAQSAHEPGLRLNTDDVISYGNEQLDALACPKECDGSAIDAELRRPARA